MCFQRASFLAYLLSILVIAGCDSGEMGSGETGAEDEDPFEDVGPGTRVQGIDGEVQIATWSDDSERLYVAATEPILENNVYVGTRYRLYEADAGGSARLLYEGTTSDFSVRTALPDLEEARGSLFFYTDDGSIYRLPVDSSEEPERLVEGATIPEAIRGSRDPFSVSGGGTHLAYYAEVSAGGTYEVRIVNLNTGAESVVVEGTAGFTSGEYTPLILSDGGSHLLHKLRTDPGENGANWYGVVDLASGSERRFTVGSLGERFYSEGSSFVAAYRNSQEIVVQHLPEGSPVSVGPFPETVGTWRGIGNWRAQTISSTAVAPGSYAFWRKGATDEGQVCAVHVIDLESGEERRLVGPIPESERGLYCGLNSNAFSLAPDGSHLVYFAPSSGDVYVAVTAP